MHTAGLALLLAAPVLVSAVQPPLTTGGPPAFVLSLPTTVDIGTNWQVCLTAPPGDIIHLLVSAIPGPTASKFGMLDVGLPLLALYTTAMPAPILCVDQVLPCNPALVGFTGYLQFVAIDPEDSTASGVSNPSTVTIANSFSCEEAPPGVPALEEVTKLLPVAPIYAGRAGFGVALDDDLVVVGQMEASATSGRAYIFSADSGAYIQTLVPDNAHAHQGFGYDVDLDDNHIVVGSLVDDGGTLDGGAVYVFDRATGMQVGKVNYPGTYRDARFGNAVAISNGVIIAGAKYDKHAGGSCPAQKSAYASTGLESCGTGWAAKGNAFIINAADGALVADLGAQVDSYLDTNGTGSWFGESVDIDGDWAVVGAHRTDEASTNNYACNSGSVYVFKQVSGTWTFQRRLLESDKACGDRFGVRLALSGSIVAIGADGKGGGYGRVYLFDVQTGTELGSISSSTAGGWFGFGVELKGSSLMVGARDIGSGTVFHFDVSAPPSPLLLNTFQQGSNPNIALEDANAEFGVGIRMSPDGSKAVVGAWYDTVEGIPIAGSAFILK